MAGKKKGATAKEMGLRISALVWGSPPDFEEIERLIKAGADLSVKDATGRPILKKIIERWQQSDEVIQNKLLRLMLDSGADLHMKDGAGRTPLIAAISGTNLVAVRTLLEYGANPNDIHGVSQDTALMSAVNTSIDDETSPKIVTALLKAGARVNVENKKKETALMHAVAYANEPSVKILLKYGASQKKNDAEGKTAMGWAGDGRKPLEMQGILKKFLSDKFDRAVARREKNLEKLDQLAHQGADHEIDVPPIPVFKKKPFPGAKHGG